VAIGSIKVTNAPGKNANAVAELTIGLVLASLRNIPALHQAVRQGCWDRFAGQELAGRTVGLLGFGNIAQKVARKLSGFDVEIIACDKYPNLEAAKKLQVTMLSAERGAPEIGCGQPVTAELEGNAPFHECEDVRMDEEGRLFRQYGTGRSGGREGSL
jgi:D-isomer specific 2-hydroxyacid dehydrogenase, NAD binding domain